MTAALSPPHLLPAGRRRRRAGPAQGTGKRRHHRARAGRTAGPCAGRRRARQAGLGRPAAGAPARVAHLLEELRRLRPADATAWTCRRRDGRRHRLAGAEEDPHRQPGQLRLRRHGAAAGAADRRADVQALAAGAQRRSRSSCAPTGWCAARNASRGRRLHAEAAGAQLHRAATAAFEAAFAAQPRPCCRIPAASSRAAPPASTARRSRSRAGPAGRARAARRWSSSPKRPRSSRPPAPGPRPGTARSGPPACRCRRSAAPARSRCRWCWLAGDRAGGPKLQGGRRLAAVARPPASRRRCRRRCAPTRQHAGPGPGHRLLRRAARRAARRPDPQPDALRVPHPGDQGGGLRARMPTTARGHRMAGSRTPPASSCRSWRSAR
jgi:hypothetical protein